MTMTDPNRVLIFDTDPPSPRGCAGRSFPTDGLDRVIYV
jgi:hypothetical protein